MPTLHRLNALQNELRDTLQLADDYKLDVRGDEVRANFSKLQLSSAFQPVIDLRDQSTLGYEALLRAYDQKGAPVAPLTAFKQALLYERVVKFDRLCRTLHTLNFLNMGSSNGLLFLNVHAELLVAVNSHGKVFEQVLHNHHVTTSNVVIEINESTVSKANLLAAAIENYRARGYKIAIDNFGKEHLNLERICALAPDYVKLDRQLIHLATQNDKLQRILPGLVTIIRDLGAKVIAVGIESPAELRVTQHAGIELAQGDLLAEPVNPGSCPAELAVNAA